MLATISSPVLAREVTHDLTAKLASQPASQLAGRQAPRLAGLILTADEQLTGKSLTSKPASCDIINFLFPVPRIEFDLLTV